MDSPDNGTQITHNSGELDQHMGTMALLAPKILVLEKEIQDREHAKQIAKKLSSDRRAKLFVEGPSDKLIIKKSISVFFPDLSDHIDIETKDSGAGHSYVYDMLSAWHAIRTHDHDKPKAAGLVDADDPGKTSAKKWNDRSLDAKSCKCFTLPTPKKLYGAFEKKFRIPITLEILYPKEVWDYSLKNGHLKERTLTKVLPETLANKILSGGQQLADVLDVEWETYVQYDYKSKNKISVAKFLSQKSNTEFKQLMGDFEEITKDIIEYLIPECDINPHTSVTDQPATQNMSAVDENLASQVVEYSQSGHPLAGS
jgi:hypothetical protein